MPRIGMSDFCDVVTKTGPSKIAAIARIKNKPKYTPAFDFYKRVREAIVAFHKQDDQDALGQALISTADATRLKHYSEVIAAYKKWMSNKNIQWFEPPVSKHQKNGFDIAVNPELGLVIDGKSIVIKLYFRGEDLPKLKLKMMNDVMAIALASEMKSGKSCGVLDVRNTKLTLSGNINPSVETMISAELAYIASVWDSV